MTVSAVIRERVTGSSNYTLYYLYDEKGSIAGLEYNGSVYYFQKNIQDDIVRICNANGGTVVKYTYDAWGNILAITDNNGNAITSAAYIANVNPFRYRGYYLSATTL